MNKIFVSIGSSLMKGLLLFCGAVGCSSSGGGAMSQDPLVAKGRAIYSSQCTACHNSNAQVDGALGPAVAGSSLDLLMARVVEGRYPEGYTPKVRAGTGKIQMPPMPHLRADIPAIHAYLNSLK